MNMSLVSNIILYSSICIVMYLSVGLSNATSTDVYCLKKVKESLGDPLNYLTSSWVFENRTEGFICQFVGIDCWHPNENRVLNIHLSDMGLQGPFPTGLENCTSMTGLDLSRNNLSGTIPDNVSKLVKYLTSLDLSFNHFSGCIPANLGNCSFLNILKLNDNLFTGQIPPVLWKLNRLKMFSVANNQLSGPVPHVHNSSSVTPDSYANNTALCGLPLKECLEPPRKSHAGIIIGAVIGAVILIFTVFALLFCCISHRAALMRKVDDINGNKWATNIMKYENLKVSMFETFALKMKLSDLMKATNKFNKSTIIGTGRTGMMYKGVLPNGYCLMIKRLQNSKHGENEFVSEMNTLGSVKHQNLVPLLGYCMAKKERLLVYKYMKNGALHDLLHSDDPNHSLDWPQRLRIGIGAARGFAWLHHTCNPRIIHRNISSKSIMLDEDLEPKLCDFGLARLMNPVETHLSTFVNGEFGDLGYVAPEYGRTLVATPKGDVYSFGIVLLELITGQRPTHVVIGSKKEVFKGGLVEWVRGSFEVGSTIDKSLVGKERECEGEMNQFLRIGLKCVVENPKERPTMFEVYQLLRALGERYKFMADDEILAPSTDMGGLDFPNELIVAREI